MTHRIDLFWSFRSPYSYIVVPKLIELADEIMRFGDTALSRPGRRGLARNALAVLRDEGQLDAATRELARQDRSHLVRDQADG